MSYADARVFGNVEIFRPIYEMRVRTWIIMKAGSGGRVGYHIQHYFWLRVSAA